MCTQHYCLQFSFSVLTRKHDEGLPAPFTSVFKNVPRSRPGNCQALWANLLRHSPLAPPVESDASIEQFSCRGSCPRRGRSCRHRRRRSPRSRRKSRRCYHMNRQHCFQKTSVDHGRNIEKSRETHESWPQPGTWLRAGPLAELKRALVSRSCPHQATQLKVNKARMSDALCVNHPGQTNAPALHDHLDHPHKPSPLQPQCREG